MTRFGNVVYVLLLAAGALPIVALPAYVLVHWEPLLLVLPLSLGLVALAFFVDVIRHEWPGRTP